MYGNPELFCSVLDYYSLPKKTLSKVFHTLLLSATLTYTTLYVRSKALWTSKPMLDVLMFSSFICVF